MDGQRGSLGRWRREFRGYGESSTDAVAARPRRLPPAPRAEVFQLWHDGYEPILTKARWCLLKRRENLTDNQEVKLKELLRYNLKSGQADLLRKLFRKFWGYASPRRRRTAQAAAAMPMPTSASEPGSGTT